MPHLLCLGLGYTARHLIAQLDPAAWRITATARSAPSLAAWQALGIAGIEFTGIEFAGLSPSPALGAAIAGATHLLVSAPPGTDGDPLLARHSADIAASSGLVWIGYLSTIGVYGDHNGGWVDETAPTTPRSDRNRRRVAAEQQWRDVCEASGKTLQIFRLGGIYGPGRGPIENIRRGKAHRIIKPGQVFNRTHVDDIAAILLAGMAGRGGPGTYNVVDDEPAPPQDVLAHAAVLLGVPPPPEVPIDSPEVSDMARSFYGDNKRVSNARMKQAFAITLRYPTYREGQRAIVKQSQR